MSNRSKLESISQSSSIHHGSKCGIMTRIKVKVNILLAFDFCCLAFIVFQTCHNPRTCHFGMRKNHHNKLHNSIFFIIHHQFHGVKCMQYSEQNFSTNYDFIICGMHMMWPTCYSFENASCALITPSSKVSLYRFNAHFHWKSALL